MKKLTPQKATLGQYDATKMTLQEILDKAAGHLLAQGERSTHPDKPSSCLYKGPNGLTCGAGPFCNKYDKEIEGDSVKRWKSTLGIVLSDDKVDLLMKLQEIHDEEPVKYWPRWFKSLAENFELNYNY